MPETIECFFGTVEQGGHPARQAAEAGEGTIAFHTLPGLAGPINERRNHGECHFVGALLGDDSTT